MKPSIVSRISRTQLLTVSALITIFACTSIFLARYLEQELLLQDFEEELAFIIDEYGSDDHLLHRTKSILIEYIPQGLESEASHHPIFEQIDIGEQKRIHYQNKDYWVVARGNVGGLFYHARDLSSLKAR